MSTGFGDCTLATCSIEQSIFQYRPSLAANGLFIALFGLSAIVHLFQGIVWRAWTFAILMILGCACEMIGYGGRIMLYQNPWTFTGFIINIVCITIGPVFMTAAIYITLYKSVMKLSSASARFKPSLYYLIFIPCDIISLILQSIGGAKSSQSQGSSTVGVAIGLAGLSFQVCTLAVFIALSIDYAVRYRSDLKSGKALFAGLDRSFKTFVAFLSLATILILVRCAYRIYELSDGYHGPALHDQGAFIGLESCMIILATFALNVGHPGWVFSGGDSQQTSKAECESVESA